MFVGKEPLIALNSAFQLRSSVLGTMTAGVFSRRSRASISVLCEDSVPFDAFRGNTEGKRGSSAWRKPRVLWVELGAWHRRPRLPSPSHRSK